MTARRNFASLSLCLTTAALAVLLTGCSTSFTAGTVTPNEVPIGNIQGVVHGGQAPIKNAEIFLFAAGKTGYAKAATSLICADPNSPDNNAACISSVTANGGAKATAAPFSGDYYVTTDAGGNFSLGGDYKCTEGDQIYMVAYGGDSGGGTYASGTNNTYIMQMAALAQCPEAGNLADTVPYLTINEISTAAFAYAMAGFGTSATNVGSPNTTLAKQGIANAMANVSNLISIQYGQALPNSTNTATGVTTVRPTQTIISLANILGTCINTDGTLYTTKKGGGYNYNGCFNLFLNTTGATKGTTGFGAKAPSVTGSPDESQAIFYIAQNPANNSVSALYKLIPTTPVFSGGISSNNGPTDWTVSIQYQNAVSDIAANQQNSIDSGPFNIAFDAQGNAWIGDRVKGVVEITPQGTTMAYNHGFGMIKGVAVAQDGSIWATDYGSDKVYQLDSSGDVERTVTSGLTGPSAVAFDTAGNILVANEDSGSISVYNSSAVLRNTYTMPVDTPSWIVVDKNGDAFLPSTDTNYVGELAKNGNSYTTSRLGAEPSYGIVLDASSNLWIGDYENNTAYELTASSNYNSDKTKTGGGLDTPHRISVDGAGDIWLPNEDASVASGYNPANGGTNAAWLAANGFSTGDSGGSVDATADPSGNLWVADMDGAVSEIIGIATPTTVPISPSTVGTEP